MLNQAQQKDEMAKKFKVFFKNTDNQEVNYAEGFRYLTLRYDSLYQTNISGREPIDKLLKNTTLSELNTGTLAQTSYIDFNIRSQLITHENGNKWILFPKIVNKEVVDLAVAILTENETRFGIYILDSNSKLYMDNIDAFRKAYNQHYKSLSKKNQFFLTPMKICGQPGDECDIDEVIIIVPPPSKPFPPMGFFPPDYGGGFPECGTYVDCIPPFYGGSMPRNPINPPTDPCGKAKTQITGNPEAQKAVKNLKEHIKSGVGGEKGWLFPKDGGSIKPAGETSAHSVKIGMPNEIIGAYHNHTGSGVDIFSATDVATLIEIARYRGIGNREDAFMGVVAPGNIHYLIRFTGTDDELPALDSYSTEMLEKLKSEQWSDYQRLIVDKSLTKEQRLEIILFNTLSKMGLENKVTLQRIDKNNNVSTISQNQNGTINVTPC
ncbi:hypothetical protein [Riemerella columbina]|uniref:hypothetical protein n=1 Tax=Riemerella columbina TaxID=103810 RepID=UPI000375E99B|nr:hypothetical protein [Riemerella columbina]